MENKNTNSVHLRLTNDLLEDIDKFTDKFNFSSRTEALRYLITLGLSFHEETTNLAKKKILKKEN